MIYGRFLSTSNASMAKPITIRTTMPATAGTKYISAADCAGASVGAAVGAGSVTVKTVS